MSDAGKSSNGRRSVRTIAAVSAMTALICICAMITIPSAVPFTLQTFGVCCAVLLIGGRDGTVSVFLYILLGALGLPVFSGFEGGITILLGPTGGYILGFLLTALLYWGLEGICRKRPLLRYAVLSGGLILCYAAGTAWFIYVMGTRGKSFDVMSALSLCVFPFLIPDAVKIFAAVRICDRVRKALPSGWLP